VAAVTTRRTALAAAAALPLLAAGCKGVGALAAPPRPAPDVALLRSAIAAEELLVARYQAADRLMGRSAGTVADQRPGGSLAALVSLLLDQHAAHLTRLRDRLIVPVPGPDATDRPGRLPSAPPLPPAPRALLADLAAAEHAAAARLARQLLAAPPALAQLLASIAAAEATHVPQLRSAERAA